MRTVSKGQFEFLRDEAAYWADSGVISREDAQKICSLYSVKSRSFAQVLLSSGALLLGLGVICAVAANWDSIPKAARMSLIVGVYIVALIASFLSGARGMPRLSQSLLLTASIVFGAGIFLAAQMFNYGGHWTTGVGWWIAGVLPVVWLFRDRWQMSLVQALTVCYIAGLDFQLWTGRLSRTFLQWEAVPAVMIAVLWVLWSRLGRDSGIFNLNAFVSAQFAFSRIADRADPVSAMILFFAAGSVVMLVFRGTDDWQESAVSWGTIISGVTGLILSIPESWTLFSLNDAVSAFFSEGYPLGFTSSGQALSSLAAAVTAAAMAVRLYLGGHTAGIFLALLALRYFVDHFFGFMSKAAAFGVLGAVCIAFGILWERRMSRKAGR